MSNITSPARCDCDPCPYAAMLDAAEEATRQAVAALAAIKEAQDARVAARLAEAEAEVSDSLTSARPVRFGSIPRPARFSVSGP